MLALVMGGCAPLAPLGDDVTAEIPAATRLADVPFFAQTRYQCGPASLAMVINHQGELTTPGQLRPWVYLPERGGSLGSEMLVAPARFALLGVRVKPSMPGLLQALAGGHPVVVMQNLGLRAWPVWHYAVVIGYDLQAREIHLRSGSEARVSYSFRVFEKTWSRAGYWAMLVVRPGAVPGGVEQRDFLRAASALERAGHFNQAHSAYLAAAGRWPQAPLAWAGVGNSAYASGRFEAAETAYRTALEYAPGDPLLLNNLAMTLAARGCRGIARKVLDCALATAPGNPLLRESALEIDGFAAGDTPCRDFQCAAGSP